MANKIIILSTLLVSLLIMHFVDAAYYNHKIDEEVKKSVNTELNLGMDFNMALGWSYPSQNDCTQLRDSVNVTMCNDMNELRR